MIMDAFAELKLPRQPAIDHDELVRRFVALSREQHPDSGGDTESFARLTRARHVVESTARRLRHLLELEFPGEKLDGPLPPHCMDLFAQLGPALQNATTVRNKNRSATSSLARALIAPAIFSAREEIESLAQALDELLTRLETELPTWDGTARSLAAWAREAAFLEKWQTQVRQALFELR
jgi:hypothetical protein